MMPDRLKTTLVLLLFCFMPFASAATNESLPAGVRSVLNLRQVPQESLSIRVEDLETGELVLDWLPAEPRNPASTMKLLTTCSDRLIDGRQISTRSATSLPGDSTVICCSKAMGIRSS